MKGMRARRQTLEIEGKDERDLLACADGHSRVAGVNEAYFPADAIRARQVKRNHDVLRLLASDRARDRLVFRYSHISCRARQPNGCAGPHQGSMLSQSILIGPIDDLPFRRIIVDLVSDALQRVMLLQDVLDVACPSIVRPTDDKRRARRRTPTRAEQIYTCDKPPHWPLCNDLSFLAPIQSSSLPPLRASSASADWRPHPGAAAGCRGRSNESDQLAIRPGEHRLHLAPHLDGGRWRRTPHRTNAAVGLRRCRG